MPIDNSLDLEKLQKLIEWLKTLTERENEAARRMGIDPEKDMLIIPEGMIPGSSRGGVFFPNLPKWARVSRFIKEPYVMRGVRDPKAKL